MPLHFGYDPAWAFPGGGPVREGVGKYLRLLRGPSNRAGHQVVYHPEGVVVRLESDCVENALVLQVLVDIGAAKAASPLR